MPCCHTTTTKTIFCVKLVVGANSRTVSSLLFHWRHFSQYESHRSRWSIEGWLDSIQFQLSFKVQVLLGMPKTAHYLGHWDRAIPVSFLLCHANMSAVKIADLTPLFYFRTIILYDGHTIQIISTKNPPGRYIELHMPPLSFLFLFLNSYLEYLILFSQHTP